MPLSPALEENALAPEEELYLERLVQFYKNSATRSGVIKKIKQWGSGDVATNGKPIYFATLFSTEMSNAKVKTLKEEFRKICEDAELKEHWLNCAKAYGVQCEQETISNFSLFAGAFLFEHLKQVCEEDKKQISAWCELIAEQYHNFRAYKTLCLYALQDYVNLPYEDDSTRRALIKRLGYICLVATSYYAIAGLGLQILAWLHFMAVELKMGHRDDALVLLKKIITWLKKCGEEEARCAPSIKNACRKSDATSENLLVDLMQACGWQKKEALARALANVQEEIQRGQSCADIARSFFPR
ncbi:MAG: hypothetical protein K0S08_358 [Gammaproteobacteria bacterium]|jgi:hypothetical protein|nr:hypothetical protein [Gammaproteobacteria bacterium]